MLTLVAFLWGGSTYASSKTPYNPTNRLAQKNQQQKLRKDAAKRLKVSYDKARKAKFFDANGKPIGAKPNGYTGSGSLPPKKKKA